MLGKLITHFLNQRVMHLQLIGMKTNYVTVGKFIFVVLITMNLIKF